MAPDEHRDLPNDLLATAPTPSRLGRVNKAIADIDDYHDNNGTGLTNTYGIEFTVLKGRVLRQGSGPGWARVEPLVASRPDRV